MAPNTSDPADGINPDDVARRTFTAVRKGFDPIEVQGFLVSVAADLRTSRQRVLELEQELRASQAEAERNRDIDPARLTALLGEETARVLDAARSASDDMRAKAADSSSRLIREATDDAARMRQEATEVLATKTREAEEEFAAVRRQIEELEEKARTDAAAQVEAGRQEGREMVAEAQKVRERMLNDLARRRKAFRQQIERLQAGRDRLLAAYDVVRDTLDVATEELQVALPEARVAAESASLRAADEDEATADELEAEAADLPDVERAQPEAATEVVDEAEAEVDEDVLELADADVAGDPEAAGPLAKSADDIEGRRSSSVKVIRAVSDEPEADLAEASSDDESDDQAGDEVVAVVEVETVDVVEVTETDDDGAEVSSLFARIRSETEVETADGDVSIEVDEVDIEIVEADVPDGPELTIVESIETVEVVEIDQAEDEDEADDGPDLDDPDRRMIARRDAALVEIERSLGRRIKRELSDEQNELLDTVRRQKGVPTADEALPDLEVHVKRYADAALASLVSAAVTGADLLDGSAKSAPKTKAGDLATELATELVEALRVRIERCFRDAAGDDEELAERLRACYREWKGQRVDELASRSVLTACNRGLIDALPSGTLVHWVVDDGSTPSPDCDDNALAGDQPKGEPFPTGHVVPPISVTCRCMVLPRSS